MDRTSGVERIFAFAGSRPQSNQQVAPPTTDPTLSNAQAYNFYNLDVLRVFSPSTSRDPANRTSPAAPEVHWG
jgi:hypothetical protein